MFSHLSTILQAGAFIKLILQIGCDLKVRAWTLSCREWADMEDVGVGSGRAIATSFAKDGAMSWPPH